MEKIYNEKEIAFIICSNNEQELNECLFYLNLLEIPEGYTTDIITVSDAPSMTAGYNAAMESSNARYKVYMHQDTFILNKHFISDIVTAFHENANAGMLGVVGCRLMKPDAYAVNSWDTGTTYYTNGIIQGYQNGKAITVDAIDGLLMVTCLDIPWREDLFTAWDFYDISQCYEFHRIGKSIIIPYQPTPWCYHANKYSVLINYELYRKIFLKEYSDFYFDDSEIASDIGCIEFENLKIESLNIMKSLLDQRNVEKVILLIKENNLENIGILEDIQLIVNIYQLEKETSSNIRFWNSNMNADLALSKLLKLKYMLIRMEYHFPYDKSQLKEYSILACALVARSVANDLEYVNTQLAKYLEDSSLLHIPSIKKDISQYQLIKEPSTTPKALFIVDNINNVSKCENYFDTNIENYLVISEQVDLKKYSLPLTFKNIQNISAIPFTWYCIEDIYYNFEKIYIIGAGLESYIRLFYGTSIPIFCINYEDTKCYGREFTPNITVIKELISQ